MNQFRSYVYDYEGFQKLSKFTLRFQVPQCLQNGWTPRVNLPLPKSRVQGAPPRGIPARKSISETTRGLEFFCQAADLPGVGMATRPIVRYGYGVVEKKPMCPLFNDMTAIFLADANHVNLKFFHEWIGCIVNYDFSSTILSQRNPTGIPTNLYEVAYTDEYKVEAQFSAWDEAGNETYRMIFRDIFPSAIPESKFSAEHGQLMQIIVMFCYTDWYLMPPSEEMQETVVSAAG